MSRWSGALLIWSAATVLSSPAFAETVEEFYKDKTVTLYVSSSAGGGTDTYGRIVAAHLGRHLPGQPRVVVSNVPGANGVVLANRLYNTLPKDGTALGTFDRYLPIQSILGNPNAKFEARKFNWIGSTNVDVSTCATSRESGITTLSDFLTKEIAIGSTSSWHPFVLNKFFGAKLKLVSGYPGGNEIDLALERGEIGARCHWSWSSIAINRADWVRDKKINVILQFSTRKHPDLPNVPIVTDLVKTERERQVVEFVVAPSEASRPFAAPPDVPPERVAALRKAFDATLADPDLLAMAQRMKLEIQPVTGEEIQKLIERVSQTPPDILEEFRPIMSGQ
jgi:tripartite-type tricarboxylate transporter receptor subunit TctC